MKRDSFLFISFILFPVLLIAQNIGIGTTTPADKVTVQTTGYGITHTDGTATIGTWMGSSMGVSTAKFGTKTNHPLNFFTNNSSPQITLLTNGYVGIGTQTPTNKLQIGSMGISGFATNDLAIGNGTHAVALFMTDASTLIGSTNDIVLRPRNNGQGRVGINTLTPRASLDVSSNVVIQDGYYAYMNGTADLDGIGLCQFCDPQISIIASYGIYAAEFDAFSDARIKNLIELSNTAEDLEVLNTIHITDYTMKDKVVYGNRLFKKVIAQDVEKVYPQVVSGHRDFIPNVYQLTDKIEKVANGYILHFASKHNISNDAKKLRILLSKKGMQEVDIVAIPSETEVIVNITGLELDKIFVYGEEVNDFRTVDYEGLTALNISATQELSKLIKQQQIAIDEQSKKIADLSRTIQLLKEKK